MSRQKAAIITELAAQFSVMFDPSNRELLTCWKEIAAYFGKGIRTVQRWERIGMPVHRPSGDRSIVFADPAELKAWALRSLPQNKGKEAANG